MGSRSKSQPQTHFELGNRTWCQHFWLFILPKKKKHLYWQEEPVLEWRSGIQRHSGTSFWRVLTQIQHCLWWTLPNGACTRTHACTHEHQIPITDFRLLFTWPIFLTITSAYLPKRPPKKNAQIWRLARQNRILHRPEVLPVAVSKQ